jgi:hypothetical protein
MSRKRPHCRCADSSNEFAPLHIRLKLRRWHPIGLNEQFDRAKTGINCHAAMHRQCRNWVILDQIGYAGEDSEPFLAPLDIHE